MKYFISLITFSSPDGSELDFGDYASGFGMWICIVTIITFSLMAINLWCQL